MKNKKTDIFIMALALILILTTFAEIPYASHIMIRTGIVLIILLYNYIKTQKSVDFIIKNHSELTNVDGYNVYMVSYDMLGSHNAALLQGRKKKFIILAEEEMVNCLNNDEFKAVLYHEVGHTYTVSAKIIYFLSAVSALLCMEGTHSLIYHNPKYIMLFLGIVICFFAEYLKRYVEYKSDEYALAMGCNARALLSAITKIEQLNQTASKITMSGHPHIKLRERNIKKRADHVK